jgi:hypothetical protein
MRFFEKIAQNAAQPAFVEIKIHYSTFTVENSSPKFGHLLQLKKAKNKQWPNR